MFLYVIQVNDQWRTSHSQNHLKVKQKPNLGAHLTTIQNNLYMKQKGKKDLPPLSTNRLYFARAGTDQLVNQNDQS